MQRVLSAGKASRRGPDRLAANVFGLARGAVLGRREHALERLALIGVQDLRDRLRRLSAGLRRPRQVRGGRSRAGAPCLRLHEPSGSIFIDAELDPKPELITGSPR